MAALLGVLQNISCLLLVAVSGRPAVQLPLGAAAELQQLLPVLFLKFNPDFSRLGRLLLLSQEKLDYNLQLNEHFVMISKNRSIFIR